MKSIAILSVLLFSACAAESSSAGPSPEQTPRPFCELLSCPAPDLGCQWVNPTLDSNGCEIDCGQLVCTDSPFDL